MIGSSSSLSNVKIIIDKVALTDARVLITGSNGLLGQNLLELFLKDPENYKVVGFSRGENRSGRTDFEYHEIDITNQQLLEEKIKQIKQPIDADCL